MSKKLRELSLALKLRTLISPSDDSRQAYLNLSDIFGKYSDEIRNLETYDYRMKRTVIRDLKKQLTALDEFFKDNKQDVSEYIDERLSWDDQDRFVLQYSSHPQTYLGYKHKEEPISDSITYDTHRIRDFSQFVVAG